VTDNTAGNAGGGVNIEDSSPLVQDNTIRNNHAGDHGGGVSMSVGSAPTIIDNLISYNSSSVKGGGVFSYASAPLIRRNEIVDNQAPTAGGIHLTGSVGFEITNNVVARNKATIEGGGIHLTSNSRGNIINNTLVNNNLGAGGEAINLRNSAKPRIANNILMGQTYGVRVREDAAPTVEYNDVWNSSVRHYEGVSGNPGHISCNPRFVNVSAGDYHLTAGSCVIDNGTRVGAPTSDFDGDSRPVDGNGDGNAAWDRGADEFRN
jgi:parallel beta-helix repeat protein